MRSYALDASRRSYGGVIRGTIKTSDDSLLMQTVDIRAKHGELITGVERPQLYGFNSIPVDEDQDGKAADVMIGFVNGDRSHPTILAEGDRRSRPKNGEKGESGLYHYLGAALRFLKDGTFFNAGSAKKPFQITVGNAVVTIADGKITLQVGGSSGPAVVIKASGVYLGGDPDQGGTFQLLQTVGGTATNSYAKTG